VALGNLSNAAGAALGLAALFAVSSAAFTVVKWAGAAYLVYLGIRMWRTAPAIADATPQAPVQPLRRVSSCDVAGFGGRAGCLALLATGLARRSALAEAPPSIGLVPPGHE
jgi:hypothetical protein